MMTSVSLNMLFFSFPHDRVLCQIYRNSAQMAVLCLLLVSVSGCQTLLGGSGEGVATPPTNQTSTLRSILGQVGLSNEAQAAVPQGAQSEADPNSVETLRSLARNLVSEQRYVEAAEVWVRVLATSGAIEADRDEYIRTLVRLERWDEARRQLEAAPTTPASEMRLQLSGLIYDQWKDWTAADQAYSQLFLVATKPEIALNNWGMSKMVRGEYSQAALDFGEAINIRPDFKNAHINLALARGFTGEFSLPSVDLTAVERAHLYHDFGMIAVQSQNSAKAEELFNQAIETHPQYFEQAVARLDELKLKSR